MTRSKRSLGLAAQVWFAFLWRSTLIFALTSTVIRLLLALSGVDADSIALLWGLLGSWAVTAFASVFAMRQALENDYNDFRLSITRPFAATRLDELEDESRTGEAEL